jgi:hypothetical protein
LKLEAGNWKLETGSWKLEAGNWKLETGLPAPRARMLGSVILNGLTTQLPMQRVISEESRRAIARAANRRLAASFQQRATSF